jgi:hypothetical protein
MARINLLYDGMIRDQDAAQTKIMELRGKFTKIASGEVTRYYKGDEIIAYFYAAEKWLTVMPRKGTY